MDLDTLIPVLAALASEQDGSTSPVIHSFSASKQGFYASDLSYPNLPDDLIELSAEEYETLKNRPGGTALEVQDGKVVVVAAPAPPNLIPAAVTKRQGRRALLQAGKLQAVIDTIAAMEGEAKLIAEIEWDSNTYERHSEFLQTLGAAIGLDDEAIDALFVLAATL